jgi:CMP-N-acetylneuraminic acid synthetase
MVDAVEVMCLVPARGGSKGIPRKNLRDLDGHPLIAYSIAAGLQATQVARTIVSTDDEEISEVARSYGAEVPFLRPSELAGDDVPDLPVFEHALAWLEANEGYRPEIVVQLRPTSPLRFPGCVDRAVTELLKVPEADALRAVAPPEQNPFKMWRVVDGFLEPLLGDMHEELFNQPRQCLPAVVWQTGLIDVARRATIVEQHSMTGTKVLPFPVGGLALDLDTEAEWVEAERRIQKDRDKIVWPASPERIGG